MSEFIVSKRIKDVVEFDKTNKKLRFLLDEGDQVYYYKDLETIGISCEYHHNLKKALAHNLVFPTYAEGRTEKHASDTMYAGMKLCGMEKQRCVFQNW